MTNYNDGKWHIWDGSDPCLHDESEVETIWTLDDGKTFHNKGSDKARNWNWTRTARSRLFSFRVIKEHKEPRDFWIVGGAIFASEEEAEDASLPDQEIIHVREVIE